MQCEPNRDLSFAHHRLLISNSQFNIAGSNPPTTLIFAPVRRPQRLDPHTCLMLIIENQSPMCRSSPFRALASTLFLQYNDLQLKLTTSSQECGFLTYNDACTTLRGLAEYMTSTGKFQGLVFDVSVSGKIVGSGHLLRLGQNVNANSSSITQPRGTGIGTV